MPELPEVEIARENLERWLLGKTILSAKVHDPRMVREGGSIATLQRRLNRAKTRSVRRRGKFLLLGLEAATQSRFTVLAHLAMSGKFLFRSSSAFKRPSDEPLSVVLRLDDGHDVYFSNPRRLGHFRLFQPSDEARLRAMGIDPFDSRFTGEYLFRLLNRSRRPLKLFLMDQANLAGLGNIQVAESLFLACLSPLLPSNRVSSNQARLLRTAIVRSLQDALDSTRAEEVQYVRDKGAGNPFVVYGRQDEPCRRCGTDISRIVQGGRSTFFCSTCQRLEGDSRPRLDSRKK